MTVEISRKRVFEALQQFGLLLESDGKLPSVASLIVDGPIVGSWWSHPSAHTIFRMNQFLADHADVLVAKLVSGKVTFIHKNTWPEFVPIASARERWQTNSLSKVAERLLGIVDAEGSVRSD